MAVKPERLPFNYRARPQVKFEGRIDSLKGYIYDCTDSRQTDQTAGERQLAMGYILGCDRVRYRKLIEDLKNQHTQGIKSFPQTLSEAYTLANNWKNGASAVQNHGVSDGVMFTTTTKTNPTKTKK